MPLSVLNELTREALLKAAHTIDQHRSPTVTANAAATEGPQENQARAGTEGHHNRQSRTLGLISGSHDPENDEGALP